MAFDFDLDFNFMFQDRRLKDKSWDLNREHYDYQAKLKCFLLEDKLSLADKQHLLEQEFFSRLGYFPNLTHPKTFNEKMNWLRLHYHTPLQKTCVDKYAVRKHIAKEIGEEYLAPLLGVYKDVADIDFAKLPSKFVIKSNGGSFSRQTIMVGNKAALDLDELKYEVNSWLLPWKNEYYHFFKPAYKGIKPLIVVEEYLDVDKYPVHYNVYCNNGKTAFIEAYEGGDAIVLDKKGNSCPYIFTSKHILPKIKIYPTYPKMLQLAEQLSKPFPFVRMDFYDLGGKLYFGEFTFYPGSGFLHFKSMDIDLALGKTLTLPKAKA